MTAAVRWCLVALVVGTLVAIPPVIAALPASEPDEGTAELLQRVQGSAAVAHTGYAETDGALTLPVTDDFSDTADLLGDANRLRVWWRHSADWRVDAVDTTGETDLFHDGIGTAVWNYQAASAEYGPDSPARLPRTADLVPSVLGRLVLGDADAADVTRLPAMRVAGRDAIGLRLVPPEPQSSIDRADVWVDAGSGLPLQVEVYGAGATRPFVSSRFLDVSLELPDAGTTRFTRPAGVEVRYDEALDIADAADRFADVAAPLELAGLASRRPAGLPGAVGQYGSGLTLLVAIPLWDRAAGPLRDQLETSPEAAQGPAGTSLTVGPLSMLLAPPTAEGSWLLTGTVGRSTLERAAAQLAAGAVGARS